MLFSAHRTLLRHRSHRRPAPKYRHRIALRFEALEDRVLFALGNPLWLSQGPTAIADSGDGLSQNGAIQSVAVDPTNPDRLFVATVEGGIWRTTNGTSSSPSWTPLTDQLPFLGTTDIEFDPTDARRNTLWAGTGRFSNNGIQNGPTVGLYRTPDGGTTWNIIGQATFQALNISNVIPTSVLDPVTGKQVILVSTQQTAFAGGSSYGTPGPGGVYRSADAGTTWTLISGGTQANGNPTGLPAGDVWQLVADPANAQRFYAGVTLANNTGGVFVTNNAGLSWQEVAGDAKLTNSPLGNVSGIKLAVHNDPNANVVYAAVVNTNGDLSAVLRSTKQGADWTRMDLPGDPVKSVNPGDQGPGNDAIAADPVNPNVVFVSGDQTFLFRGDASQPAGGQWTSITGAAQQAADGSVTAGANGTAPHADSRSMTFEANGNLLETDDGGIYRLTAPNNPATRRWSFLSGNIIATATTFVAYDSVNHVIVGGAQDNGSPQQTAPDSLLAVDASSGDGQVAQVDNTSTPGFSIRYTSNQNLGLFRATYNGANNAVTAQPIATVAVTPLTVTGTGKAIKQVDKPPFTTQFVLNAVNPSRLLIGTRYLYESTNRGDTVTALMGLTPDGKPKGDLGVVTALAYGGRLNGQDAPDVAYVGTGKDRTGRLFLRSQAGGTFTALANYPGSTPLQIVLDPDNWQTGYLLDDNSRVWRMTNAGVGAGDFTNITGNLNTLGLTILKSLAVFPNTTAPNDEVVFVGGYRSVTTGGVIGGVAATDSPTQATWANFGTGLPNVMVTGLVYDGTDNVLAASTYGRGFWIVKGLTNFAGRAAPVLKLGAPTAAGNDFSAQFTAGGPGVALTDLNASLVDPASATLTRVTITLTNPQDGISEALTANTAGTNITASTYNPTSGQLILSGTDSLANYQKVLTTVTYTNTAAPPTNTTRVFNVVATDGVASGRATSSITIVGGGAPPTVGGGGGGGTGGSPPKPARAGQPTAIGSGLQVQDPAATNLVGATVTITNLLDAPDELLEVDTTGTAITAQYNAQTGILTLNGTDTVAHYQQVLDSLTYDNVAEEPNPQPRTVRIVVKDATQGSLAEDVVVDIVPINHAPTLASGAVFTADPINQGDVNNSGTFVSDLIDSAVPGDAISDPDPDTSFGMAVVGVDDTHGRWQYTIDGGDTWQDFVDVSPARAVLLTDDDSTLVRFVPAAGFAGVVPDGLTFRAWDQSSGQLEAKPAEPEIDGSLADTTQNGGNTGFSTATAQAGITVNALTTVGPPPSNSSPDQQWLTQVYQDLLHRPIDAGGQAFWGGQLAQGVGRVQVVLGLEQSAEYHVDQVQSLYHRFLGRDADLAGLTAWQQALAGGVPVTQVEAGILGSAEYAARHGGSSGGFLMALYQDALGRSADAGGLAAWSGLLAQGVRHDQVALAFLQSVEGSSHTIEGLFSSFLNRPADPGGLLAGVTALEQGVSLDVIQALLLGSGEYFSEHTSP